MTAKSTTSRTAGAGGRVDEPDNQASLVETMPTYNLKAVVRETGLKPDTLRAWERRYGLPRPDRTTGGHRLYSLRDIEMLKWLVARQDEGMSISHAAALWLQLEEAGEDPLTSDASLSGDDPSTTISGVEGNLPALREAWIAACAQFNERAAEKLISEAFALFPLETVCFELLQKGLAEIGARWYAGEMTVQQEHFASALAIRRLETLMLAAPVPHRSGRILAACPPEERHTFGLLLISLLLRRSGWEVIYLGANVPTARLESTLAAARPHLVILSAQTLHTASTMLPMARLLEEERVVVAYGGAVFSQIPALHRRMPGYFLGEKIDQVLSAVERLMSSPGPMSAAEPAGREFRVTLDHYLDRRPTIEARIWDLLKGRSQQFDLNQTTAEMGQNIAAALAFGDLDLLTANLTWVEGLLVNHHIPMSQHLLNEFIQAYHDAARDVLDERGQILVDWLAGAPERILAGST